MQGPPPIGGPTGHIETGEFAGAKRGTGTDSSGRNFTTQQASDGDKALASDATQAGKNASMEAEFNASAVPLEKSPPFIKKLAKRIGSAIKKFFSSIGKAVATKVEASRAKKAEKAEAQKEMLQSGPTGEQICKNPKLHGAFKAFLVKEYASENIDFLKDVHDAKAISDPAQRDEAFQAIYDDYIKDDAGKQINLPAPIKDALDIHFRENKSNHPSDTFDNAFEDIGRLLKRDSWTRFKLTPECKQLNPKDLKL